MVSRRMVLGLALAVTAMATAAPAAFAQSTLSGIVIPGDFISVQKVEHRISISLKTLLIFRKDFLLS